MPPEEPAPTPPSVPVPNHRPWLIAAFPGMGNVAVIAAGYLIRQLKATKTLELPSHDHFDIAEVGVKKGVVERARLPRGLFFRWTNPHGPNLVIFFAEAQPTTGIYAYAHELLEVATGLGVERVVTFASIASALHPGENPRVFGVATDRKMLAELKRVEISPLEEGPIGGLNGVLLAAAADRGMSGMCLLSEIPFFAAATPNPKAARAVLSVFSVLTTIDVNLEELSRHAETVDQMLIQAFEKLKEQGIIEEHEPGQDDDEPGARDEEADEPSPQSAAPKEPSPAEPALDYATRKRLEKLFEEAKKDTNKAVSLKRELDRLGVFRQYENRFLDLFRRAG